MVKPAAPTKEETLAAAAKRLRKMTPQRLLDKAFRLWRDQQMAEVNAHIERILARVPTATLVALNPKMPQLLFRAGLGGDWYIPGTEQEIRQFAAVSLARLRWNNRMRRRPELAFNLTIEDAEAYCKACYMAKVRDEIEDAEAYCKAYYMGKVRDAINVTSGMHVVNEEGGVLTVGLDVLVDDEGKVLYETEASLRLDGENLVFYGVNDTHLGEYPISSYGPQQVVTLLEELQLGLQSLLTTLDTPSDEEIQEALAS